MFVVFNSAEKEKNERNKLICTFQKVYKTKRITMVIASCTKYNREISFSSEVMLLTRTYKITELLFVTKGGEPSLVTDEENEN